MSQAVGVKCGSCSWRGRRVPAMCWNEFHDEGGGPCGCRLGKCPKCNGWVVEAQPQARAVALAGGRS